MTQVTITYPTHPDFGDNVEHVNAREVPDQPGRWELTGHAFLTPLGPGDVVEADDDMNLTSVVSLEPQFIYHVELHLPADYLAGPLPDAHPAKRISERLLAEWKRDAWVTELHGFTVAVSSQSQKWLDDKVKASKYVEHMTLTRTPDVESVAIEVQPVL